MKKIWNFLNYGKLPKKSFYPLLACIVFFAILLVSYLFYWGDPILERDAVTYIKLMKYYDTNGKLPMVWYISSLPFILFRFAGMIPGMTIECGMFLVNNLAFGTSIFLIGMISKKLLKNTEAALACAMLYAHFCLQKRYPHI